ncbi:GGDEF domain-containing protein [Litchfieldella rifensis]|uniref:diguanylate cyclase n=1 Tax=Litchfieldella rifensis TaxID=762643 RepID=A0ABV7LN22_9GAMM
MTDEPMLTLFLMALVAMLIFMSAVALVHVRYRRPLKTLLEGLDECERGSEPMPAPNRAAPLVARLADRVNRLKTTNHLLHQQSIKDPLTGLGNRRLLEQRLEIALPLSRRWMNAVSALMIDVDHFKDYNDLYGHQAGDDCLIEIANVLRDTFRRETDIVVRLGGEEFLVVLLDAEEDDATRLAEAMRGMLQAVGIPHQGSLVTDVVTVSIGVSTTASGWPVSLEDMIATADAALYECKAKGRNCVTSRRVFPEPAAVNG